MYHSTVSIIMSTTCLNVVRISERQLFMNYIDALREASIKAPSHLIIHEVSSLIRIKYFLGTSLIIEIEFQIQILYLFIISRFIYTYSIYICSLAFDMACILILMMSSSLRSTAVTVASTTTRNTSRPCTCLNGVIYTYRLYRYEHDGCSRKNILIRA